MKMRFYSFILLSMLFCGLVSPVLAQTVTPVIYLGQEKVSTVTMSIHKMNQRMTKYNEYITKQKESLTQGVNALTDSAWDVITTPADMVNDQIKGATDWANDQIKDAGDYLSAQASDAADTVSGWFSSSDAGDGFSLSGTAESVGEVWGEYGEYAAPVASVAGDLISKGSIDVGTVVGSVGSTAAGLYIDNNISTLSAGDVKAIRGNMKSFIDKESPKVIQNSARIMNATQKFEETKKKAEKLAAETTNIQEDNAAANGAGIALPVMTDILVSSDITSLSIQSALTYQEMNSLKAGEGSGLIQIPQLPGIF